LRPWREIVTPHPDVGRPDAISKPSSRPTSGRSIRAGIGRIQRPHRVSIAGRSSPKGLKKLLANSLQRWPDSAAPGGWSCQTNSAAAKTHSMLALWHVVCRPMPAGQLPAVETVTQMAGVSQPPKSGAPCWWAFGCPGRYPRQARRNRGPHTLGRAGMATGRQEGYAMVRSADEKSVSPGDSLRLLFNKYSPCLILIRHM